MKSFAHNFLSLLGADLVRRLLGFISVAYLARVLGADAFGIVNIGFAVLSYSIMMSSMGLSYLGAREIAKGASNEVVWDILSLRLVLALAMVTVTGILVFLFVQDATTRDVVIFFLLSTFAYAMLIEWYFQGIEEMSIMGIGRVASPLLYLLVVVLFVRSAQDVLWVAAGSVAGDLLFAFVLLWRFRQRGGSLVFRIRPQIWKSMLRQAFPIAAGSILAQFTVNAPPIIIAVLMSTADVGIFSAASKIVFYLLMVDRVVSPLLLPAFTRWQGISSELLAKKMGEAIRWLMVVGLPVAAGGTLMAQPIVRLVFGEEYAAAGDVLRIFIWYFFLTIFCSVYSNSLLALGHNKLFGTLMMISAALSLVAVSSFTWLYGPVGTAFGIVVAEGMTLIVLHAKTRNLFQLMLPPSMSRLLLGSAVMSAVVAWFASANMFLVIVLGAVVYSVVVLGTRAVTIQEILTIVKRA